MTLRIMLKTGLDTAARGGHLFLEDPNKYWFAGAD